MSSPVSREYVVMSLEGFCHSLFLSFSPLLNYNDILIKEEGRLSVLRNYQFLFVKDVLNQESCYYLENE